MASLQRFIGFVVARNSMSRFGVQRAGFHVSSRLRNDPAAEEEDIYSTFKDTDDKKDKASGGGGGSDERTPIEVGEKRFAPDNQEHVYYKNDKYRNHIELLGRVVGRVFVKEGSRGEEWGSFNMNTMVQYREDKNSDEKAIRQATHKVNVNKSGLISLIKKNDLRHGSRIMVTGQLRYRDRTLETNQGEKKYPEPYIQADDLLEVHSFTSWSNPKQESYDKNSNSNQ